MRQKQSGKTVGALVQVKAMALHCARSQCSRHTLVAVKQNPKLSVVLQNVLTEVLEINCINYQPLSTHLFNILCDEVGMIYKGLLFYTMVQSLS